MTRSIFSKLLVAAIAVALLVPTAALAQSSNEGYGGPNNVVSGVGDSGGPSTPAAAPVETSDAAALPFTGADLGVLLAAGAILLALGLGLRRMTHRPSGA